MVTQAEYPIEAKMINLSRDFRMAIWTLLSKVLPNLQDLVIVGKDKNVKCDESTLRIMPLSSTLMAVTGSFIEKHLGLIVNEEGSPISVISFNRIGQDLGSLLSTDYRIFLESGGEKHVVKFISRKLPTYQNGFPTTDELFHGKSQQVKNKRIDPENGTFVSTLKLGRVRK